MTISDIEKVKEAYSEVDRENSAEYMAELLMDDTTSTWKMFEELASEFINGNEDVRKGIDTATILLTGWSMETISENLLERQKDWNEEG